MVCSYVSPDSSEISPTSLVLDYVSPDSSDLVPCQWSAATCRQTPPNSPHGGRRRPRGDLRRISPTSVVDGYVSPCPELVLRRWSAAMVSPDSPELVPRQWSSATCRQNPQSSPHIGGRRLRVARILRIRPT